MTRSEARRWYSEPRFWDKVRHGGPADCWEWMGAKNPHGYGRFWVGRKCYQAHRVIYEGAVGTIPDGLVIDHLCRVRHCVNPSHMEPVTDLENRRRGDKPGRKPKRELVEV
jgi:hypothetical protein